MPRSCATSFLQHMDRRIASFSSRPDDEVSDPEMHIPLHLKAIDLSLKEEHLDRDGRWGFT